MRRGVKCGVFGRGGWGRGRGGRSGLLVGGLIDGWWFGGLVRGRGRVGGRWRRVEDRGRSRIWEEEEEEE